MVTSIKFLNSNPVHVVGVQVFKSSKQLAALQEAAGMSHVALKDLPGPSKYVGTWPQPIKTAQTSTKALIISVGCYFGHLGE